MQSCRIHIHSVVPLPINSHHKMGGCWLANDNFMGTQGKSKWIQTSFTGSFKQRSIFLRTFSFNLESLYIYINTILMRFYEYCLYYLYKIICMYDLFCTTFQEKNPRFFFCGPFVGPKTPLWPRQTPTLGGPRRDHNEGHAQLQQPCNAKRTAFRRVFPRKRHNYLAILRVCDPFWDGEFTWPF